jgi:DNA-binding XRE family transcriptional regulator
MCPYGKIVGETMGRLPENINQNTTYGKISTAEELGRIIRHKRKEIGVRQEIAAGMAGVGTKFLSQLENGKETAELGKTLQVLRKMGLEVYIFPRSADPFKER